MAAEVLLVEDSPGVIRMTRDALAEANPGVNVSVATVGAEALAFLRHEAKCGDSPESDLILLDLNLPQMDRRQVLAEIKQDEPAKHPDDHPDHFGGRGGHRQELSASGQPLPGQAGPVVPKPHQEQQRIAANQGQATETRRMKLIGDRPVCALLTEARPGDVRLTLETILITNVGDGDAHLVKAAQGFGLDRPQHQRLRGDPDQLTHEPVR